MFGGPSATFPILVISRGDDPPVPPEAGCARKTQGDDPRTP
jgi:hypothetical protein